MRCFITEEIVDTLHEVSGHTFDTIYDLHFTTERIIAVLIRSPGDVMPSTSWFSILISSRGSTKKENKERDEIAADRHRKSRSLEPDEMLTSSNYNFEIKNSDIVSVEMKRNIIGRYDIKFELNISGKKFKRSFGIGKGQSREARQLLNKLFPTKFKA